MLFIDSKFIIRTIFFSVGNEIILNEKSDDLLINNCTISNDPWLKLMLQVRRTYLSYTESIRFYHSCQTIMCEKDHQMFHTACIIIIFVLFVNFKWIWTIIFIFFVLAFVVSGILIILEENILLKDYLRTYNNDQNDGVSVRKKTCLFRFE